jgi:hypothetical protein
MALVLAAATGCAKQRQRPVPNLDDRDAALAGPGDAAAGVVQLRDATISIPDASTLDAGRPKLTNHEEFCQQRAEHYCSVLSRCCGVDASFVPFCVRVQRWSPRAYQASCAPTAAGTDPSSFDLMNAQSCLDATLQSYDGCQLVRSDTSVYRTSQRACAAVAPIPGPKPGERCTASERCMSPAGTYNECQHGTDGQPDLCGAPVNFAKLGERCPARRCGDELACSRSGGVCVAPLPDGEACRYALECASGECTLEPGSMDGQCATQKANVDAAICAELVGLSRYGLYAEPVSVPRLNSRDLVWWNERAFFHAPKDGSGPVTEIPWMMRGLDIHAFDDEHLFGLDSSGRQVVVVSLRDGASESIPLDFKADRLALDASQVYAASATCDALARISKVAHGIERMRAQLPAAPVTGAVDRAQLEVDDSGAYCANRFAVFRYPTQGMADAALLASLREQDATLFIERLVLGQQQLWLFATTLDSRGAFLRTDKATGVLTKVVDATAGLYWQRIFDRTRNRWLEATADGVLSVSIDGAQQELLPAAPMLAGEWLATDTDFVYWSHGYTILRRALP